MSGSRSRSLVLALALSFALHLLGWLVLSRTSAAGAPPARRAAEPVEISVEERSRPSAPPSTSRAVPSLRPAPQGGERVKGSRPAPAVLRPIVVTRPAPPPGQRPTVAATPEGAAPSEAENPFPVDAPKALVLDAPVRDFGKPGAAEKVGSGGETIRGEPVAEAPEIRAKRAQQAIDGWIEDDEASQRVEQGLVDSYFADVGKSLEGAFKDGEKHAKSSSGKGAIAAKSFLSGYAQSASHFGSTGNPSAPAGDLQDMQQRYGLLPTLPGPSSAQGELAPRGPSPAGMASLLNFADGSSGGGLVAVVELHQTKTGTIVQLSLKHGSGDTKFDKWVLAEIPEGIAKLDPPPTEGAGIHEKGLHTLWAFEGHISYMRKVSDIDAKEDWWYAPLGTVLGAMAGHFDIGSSDVEYFDPRHPHFVVNAKLLRVY